MQISPLTPNKHRSPSHSPVHFGAKNSDRKTAQDTSHDLYEQMTPRRLKALETLEKLVAPKLPSYEAELTHFQSLPFWKNLSSERPQHPGVTTDKIYEALKNTDAETPKYVFEADLLLLEALYLVSRNKNHQLSLTPEGKALLANEKASHKLGKAT